MAHSLALDLNSVELQHLHSTHTKKILPPNRTWTCVVDSALRLFTLPPPCWRTRSNGGLARQWSYWNWQERIQRDGPSRPEAEVVEILIWAAFPCTNAQAWHKQTFFNHPSLRWLQRVERVFGLRLGFPSKSHTDKWIKWAEKPNAAVWGPALTGGVQRVWPLCCFEALPDSLKVFIGMPRVHLWVTPEPPSKIQLEVQQIRVFIKQCRTVWLVDLKRLIWLLLGVFDPWADASDTEWPQRYNWFVWDAGRNLCTLPVGNGNLTGKKKTFGNGKRLRIVTGQKFSLTLKPQFRIIYSELFLLQGVTDYCFLVLHVWN